MLLCLEGAVTSIARDALGQPLAMTRSGGTGGHNVTRAYTYDAHQQLCKTVEPETGATLMRYDAAGNLAWSAAGQTDTAGCGTLTHADRKSDRTYDQRGRLKTLRFTDTRGDQDWSYTPDGLPLSVVTVNRVGAVHPINQYVYNRRRMLVSETQHLPAWYSYSTAYSYDANGSLSRIHYPSTDYVDFAPNALGQATRARNSAGHDYAANVTYHPNGSIAGFTYGNGIVHAMTQNARQLPLQVTNTGVISDSYSYDANGNVEGIVDAASGGLRSKSMTYDGLDRLLSAHSPVFGGDGYARYTYDVLDNLRTVKTATRDHTYWYDAKNQLTGVIDTATNGTVTGLAYDRSGNVQQKNGQAYDFDYGNRLREVLDVERYRYDAYGRRILAMSFTQGTITSLYSNAGQLLFQRNERVGEMKDIDHVYLAGSLIAQRETPVGGGTATIKYQHTDALGTPVVVTGAGQAVLDRVDYEPYGKALTPGNNTGKDRPGFTGHVEDRATSLTYMQQRYQDPELGVFLSVDPISVGAGGASHFNRYRYVYANPYKFFDPDGRQGCAGSRLRKWCEGYGWTSGTGSTFGGNTGSVQKPLTHAGRLSSVGWGGQVPGVKEEAAKDGFEGTPTLRRTFTLSKSSPNGGYWIQEITVTQSGKLAGGGKYEASETFYEAFRVIKGESVSRRDTFRIEMVPEGFETLVVKYVASAKYYEGIGLPAGMEVGNVPAARGAPSSRTAPAIHADAIGPIDRVFEIKWP